MSPTGDPQNGDGSLANPFAASILWTNDGSDNPIGAGMAVGFLPGTYQQSAPMRFPLAEGQGPDVPVTSSAKPLILAGVDASGELLSPIRASFGGTGPLRPDSLRRIDVDPNVQFMNIVPPTTTCFGLHVVGSVNEPLVYLPPPASFEWQLARVFDSCLIENGCDKTNASGTHSNRDWTLFNCDVLVQGTVSACDEAAVGEDTVKGRIGVWTDTSRLGLVSCRLGGGAVGVRVGKNTRVYGCLLDGHTEAGVWVDREGGGMLVMNSTIDQAASGVLYEPPGVEPETWSAIVNTQATGGSVLFRSTVADVAWLLLNDRAGGMTQSPPYEGLNPHAAKLTLLDESAPPPGGDYVDASTGDFRLKGSAPGKHASLLSRNDLGAFKNQDDG